MESFCKSCDVDFNAEMCSWESGEQEHFEKWKGWHASAALLHFRIYADDSMQDDAQYSTGIAKPAGDEESRAAKEAKKARDIADMPEAVHKAIEENMETYEYLHAKAAEFKS